MGKKCLDDKTAPDSDSVPPRVTPLLTPRLACLGPGLWPLSPRVSCVVAALRRCFIHVLTFIHDQGRKPHRSQRSAEALKSTRARRAERLGRAPAHGGCRVQGRGAATGAAECTGVSARRSDGLAWGGGSSGAPPPCSEASGRGLVVAWVSLKRGWTWGSRRGRGYGAWRRAVRAAARTGSSVGSVAARLPSIGSGGIGS